MLECPIWSQTYFALSPWPINIDAKKWRFAARTLIHWYRAGLDVERELPKLATYLGHVHVNETYWYLEAVPELLQLATDRLLNHGKEDRS